MPRNKKTSHARPTAPPSNAPRPAPPTDTWQLVERLAAQRAQSTVLPSLVNFDNDNSGEAAWRNHEPPSITLSILSELLLVSDGREQVYITIAHEHDAFVFPLDGSTENRFGIWGSADQARATQQALVNWITREQTSNNNTRNKFGTLRSLTVQQRERAHQRWWMEVYRHRFRQAPPTGTGFKGIGLFSWPTDIDVEEALGRSLEVLDQVRMDCSCHIIRQENHKHNIQVLGDDEDVEQAILRIRSTYFQLTARQYKATRQYHVDNLGDSIVLHEYNHTQRLEPATFAQPRVPGRSYQNSDWTQPAELSSKELGQSLSNDMMSTIRRLHYLRGNVRFTIRLGMFLAVQHMEPVDGSYTGDEFQSMTMQSQFIGETTEEIGDRACENNVLDVVRQSDSLLLPLSVQENTLAAVEPTFDAIFVFREGHQELLLTLTWAEGVITSRRWSKAETTQLIDINLLNLNSGAAWHFDMQSSQSIVEQRIPAALVNFADRIKFDPRAARKFDSKLPFVSMIPAPSLRSMRVQAIHRYQYLRSGYSLEIRRFQLREYTRTSTITKPMVTTYEPRVALEVTHPAWSKMLVRHDRLGVGHRAHMSEKSVDWFPAYDEEGRSTGEDEGLMQLLALLRHTEAVIRPRQDQIDEHTGMAIG